MDIAGAFDGRLRKDWPLAEVGFAVSLAGQVYCPQLFDRAEANRFLRENAILAGVDPRFRVLNEQEAFALEQKSAIDALDQFLTESPLAMRGLLRALYTPDLAESMMKRDCQRKDASEAVPGFGGVLDVVDAVIFSAPVTYVWLVLV